MIEKIRLKDNIDPRTKIIIVICISTLAVIVEYIPILVFVLIIGVAFLTYFQGNYISILRKMRYFIYIVVGIVVIQSIFVNEGNVLISVGDFKIITDVGLTKGIEFLLRMFIIIVSGGIIATSNSRYLIQGLVQWKVPYDIAFMVNVGIRFVPILMEEAKDTVTAINLRGIDTKNLKIKEKVELYSYVFMPIIVSTLVRAQKVSVSVETRGFRAYNNRTSILKLKMLKRDYVIISISIIFTYLLLYWYYFLI